MLKSEMRKMWFEACMKHKEDKNLETHIVKITACIVIVMLTIIMLVQTFWR